MLFFFFFNDTATTEIYTLSLHDALPISSVHLLVLELRRSLSCGQRSWCVAAFPLPFQGGSPPRSEEHTSELQSRLHLVCRLLLEKKKELRRPIHHDMKGDELTVIDVDVT